MSETAPEPAGPARAFTFDGQVSEEKLAELLALGAEHSSLDFKKELNLNEPLKKLDFIKDCAAMMNQPHGGYLVIGANDDGTPAPGYLAPTKDVRFRCSHRDC
ncbi:helix-turn-helix domain-containing protein [Pseudarthrobacter sp. NamB4]|uniref:AlbA family DNA-binding domain-containing protein n=1 Tax=Pseudarthrobacter sp. NamB4 TaxID=2576837 RepID=UPI0010FEA9E7|nr:ATP-binding protein [Pseudarthrobacter sp. NamB4]TLM73139.1 ATP-binding protein [Pseudarthrobacter sp. NamB4]